MGSSPTSPTIIYITMSDIFDCPFCNLEDRVLKQNEYAQLFLSNPHKVPGHIIVIPKRHIEKPWELSAEELKDVFDLIFYAEQRIVGKLGTGADIRQNYRPFKKQDDLKVDHMLFHVVPRSKDDYIYQVSECFEKDLYADLDDLERAEVSKLLEE